MKKTNCTQWSVCRLTLILTAVLTIVWGCSSSEDDTTEKYTSVATSTTPAWSVDLSGSDPAPTWTAPDPSLYWSSMYIMVKLQDELLPYSSVDDHMAVFIGDECRTVPAIRNLDKDGNAFFVLKIRGGDSDRDAAIELRYYSATLRRLFVLDGISTFVPERTIGNIDDFVPPLLRGCTTYPVQDVITVTLPPNMPFTPADTDLVAFFVGNDCRGVGTVGKSITVLRTTAEELLQVRYYSTRQSVIYTMTQPVLPTSQLTIDF